MRLYSRWILLLVIWGLGLIGVFALLLLVRRYEVLLSVSNWEGGFLVVRFAVQKALLGLWVRITPLNNDVMETKRTKELLRFSQKRPTNLCKNWIFLHLPSLFGSWSRIDCLILRTEKGGEENLEEKGEN